MFRLSRIALSTGPHRIAPASIVGLIASPERIIQIRQNRLLSLNADTQSEYIDRDAVAEEIAGSRRFFAERRWPMIE